MPPPAPAPLATRKTAPRSKKKEGGNGGVAPPGTPPFLMNPEEALRDGERQGQEAESTEQSQWSDAADYEEETRTSLEGVEPPGPLAEDAGTLACEARSDLGGAPISTVEPEAGPEIEPEMSVDDSAAVGPLADEGAPEGEEVPPPEGEGEEPLVEGDTTTGGEGEETGEGGEGGAGGGGPKGRPAAVEAPDLAGMESMGGGDLDLIDTELAEHQRWAGALAEVGTAGSADRAGFVLKQIGEGFATGLAGGAGMGLGLGLLHRGLNSQLAARAAAPLAARMGGPALARTGAASQAAAKMAGRLGAKLGPKVAAQCAKFTPLPAIGAVIGGVISFHSLYTRDWSQTGATIANFGEGGSKYETLANSIAAISEIIDVVSNVLNVIAGLMGIVTLALWVGAVLTAGALSPLAGTLTALSLAIGAVTLALDMVNMIVLQPCVTLFRALHTFTSDADPREVVADGQTLSTAAAANGGAIGGLAGAHMSNLGGAKPKPGTPESTTKGDDTPPPAAGDGPRVEFEAKPVPPELPPPAAAEGGPPVSGAPPHPAESPAVTPLPADAPSPAPAAVAEGGPLATPIPEPRPAIPPPGGPDVPIPDIPKPPLLPHVPVQVPPGPVPGVKPLGPTEHPPVNPLGPTEAPPPPSTPAPAPDVGTPHPAAPDVPAAPPSTPAPAPDVATPHPAAPDVPATPPSTPAPVPDAGTPHPAAPGVPASPPAASAAAPSPATPKPAEQLTLPGTQGPPSALRPLTAPLQLEGFGGPGPVPQGLEPGAIGTYGRATATPHPFALESNPPGAPGATAGGGRMPQEGRETAGVYYEHQTPASVAHEVLPGHQYHGPKGPTKQRRGGRDTVEALVISLPEPAKGIKDPLDQALLTEVRARKAQGEAVSPIEVIARGAEHSQAAISQSGSAVPGGQVSKTFLAEVDVFHDPKFGYGEVRPGADLPPGHPLRDATPAEIDAFLNQTFDPFIQKPASPATPAPQPAQPAPNPNQLAFDFNAPPPAKPPAPQPPEGAPTPVPPSTPRPPEGAPSPAPPSTPHPPEGAPTPVPPSTPAPDGAPPPATPPVTPSTPPAPDVPSPTRPPSDTGPAPAGVAPKASTETLRTTARAQEAAEEEAVSRTSSTLGVATQAATAAQSGRPPPGSSPSLAQRFFPIFFAGQHGPSPEEQQAAFNAKFTADFPPVKGEERANPAYPEPPCTPAQIEAIRGHIAQLRQARAQATHAEGQMDTQLATHTANEGPLAETVATTEAGIEATEQHGEKTQCTADANTAQQERQTEVAENVSHYSEHESAIDGLRTPARAFQGMMDLASYLPSDAGEAMASMNQDATQMLAAFDEMDASMAAQETEGEVCTTQLEGDATQIEATSTEGEATLEEMTTAQADATVLEEQNTCAVEEATENKAAAEAAGGEIDSQIDEQESKAESLAQQLQSWAEAHRAARMTAVQATQAKVEDNDLAVTAVHTE